MKSESQPKTIDTYIAAFPEDVQNILAKIRCIVSDAAPDAAEAMKYQIPTFVLGENLVHFAAFEKHIGFYPTPSGIEQFKDALSDYKSAKGSVQFPLDSAIPYNLIKRIVKFRVNECLDKLSSKSLKKKTKTSKPAANKPAKTLPASMVTGKASSAKAADGDEPVFTYIASLPQPQRGIAECIDVLAAKTLPGLQRSVKWGMSYYGVADGWCFSCGGFADHVKLMFVNGTALVPVPPVTPLAMGKSTRGVELKSLDDIDKRLITAWMKQIATVPGVGKKKK
jgi:uncharacterized protein YdhG (YjbR/CyaY superfamily)